ncbi:MAG TPA: DNA translocase FtsK, partial [Chloroflexota bacterium]|nr:DNA translocase FtsK [Chloroflexota bacterium]
MGVQMRGGGAAIKRASFGPSPGAKKGGGFKLPVIPPDALLNLRFLGIVLAGVSAYTLVALLSPTGTLTRFWAERATELAGWAAGPWSVLAGCASIALYRGRRSLRRAVAGRLAGATLLLVAAASVHQLTSGLPAGAVNFTSGLAALGPIKPGVDGRIGLYTGAGLAAWFGVGGAVALMAPVAVLGLGLLCGWSAATWQKLGRRALGWLAALGRVTLAIAGLVRALCVALGRGALLVAAGASRQARATVLWTRQRYARWKINRALAAERKAAERAAQQAEREREEIRRAAQEAQAAQAARLAADASAPSAVTADPNGAPGAEPALAIRKRRSAEAPGVTMVRHTDQSVGPGTLLGAARSPIQWQLPSTSMLSAITADQISEAEIAEKKRLIERTLTAFSVPVTVKEARVGPTVTQFSLVPAEGVSVKHIKRYEADLQLVLAATTLRIELPIPGRPVVGLEIPNSGIATVGLREVLESAQFRESKGKLRLALGRDVDGKPRVAALERMPHLLIAGQTGSGKSGCVNSIIASLLFQCTPDELQLLMIDPKMVEMAEYEGIPHLKYPVVTDLAEAGKVLLWAIAEMERRYKMLSELNFRNIESYNRAIGTIPRQPGQPEAKALPYMVTVIDELADLMMFSPDDVEPAICRLSAKARAVGIHLVVATQRPSVDVVTGLIKANMPSRIAFAVASQIDSRVILDAGGAETLLGRGDMLFLPYDQGKPLRAQGTWVNDDEISALIHFWKKQGSPQYVQREEIDALMLKQEQADAEKNGERSNPLMDKALAVL